MPAAIRERGGVKTVPNSLALIKQRFKFFSAENIENVRIPVVCGIYVIAAAAKIGFVHVICFPFFDKRIVGYFGYNLFHNFLPFCPRDLRGGVCY